jgi:hypothetical protein
MTGRAACGDSDYIQPSSGHIVTCIHIATGKKPRDE